MDPGVYQISETADAALGRLAVLAVYDRGIERRRRLCGWLIVPCVPALLFFLAADSLDDWTRLGGLAAALALGAFLFVRWRVYAPLPREGTASSGVRVRWALEYGE